MIEIPILPERLLILESPETRVYIKDPTDGGNVLRNDNREMLFQWCNINCKGKFWIGMGFGKFEYDEDRILFTMTWG